MTFTLQIPSDFTMRTDNCDLAQAMRSNIFDSGMACIGPSYAVYRVTYRKGSYIPPIERDPRNQIENRFLQSKVLRRISLSRRGPGSSQLDCIALPCTMLKLHRIDEVRGQVSPQYG